MEKKYQSEQLMVCHMEAEALYKIGAIDAARMREYDEGCLVPQENASMKAPKAFEVADHPATA
jgi:DNA-binding transcriptional regulator YiaG